MYETDEGAYVLEALLGAPIDQCNTHGWQLITTSGSGPGFTGARIYWWELACGCSGGDFSADNLEAAR